MALGHRRVANELFQKARTMRLDQAKTFMWSLLCLDDAVSREGETISARELSRRTGTTRRTAEAHILLYQEHQQSLVAARGSPPLSTTNSTTLDHTGAPPLPRASESGSPLRSDPSKRTGTKRTGVRGAAPKTAAPDSLTSEQFGQLRKWCDGTGSESTLSEADLIRAVETTLDHFRGSGEPKVNWVAVIRNAIRKGWALRGGGRPGAPLGGADGWDQLEAEEIARKRATP